MSTGSAVNQMGNFMIAKRGARWMLAGSSLGLLIWMLFLLMVAFKVIV